MRWYGNLTSRSRVKTESMAPLPPNMRWCGGKLEILTEMVTLSAEGLQNDAGHIGPIGDYSGPILATSLFFRVRAGSIFGATVQTDSAAYLPPSSPPPWDWAPTESGSWEITVETEEWVDVLPAEDLDADGFPTCGGTGQKDHLKGLAVTLFEKTKPGGTLVATITAGGVTATATHTITSAVRVRSYAAERRMFPRMSENANFGAKQQCELYCMDAIWPAADYDYTDGDARLFISGNDAYATIALNGFVSGSVRLAELRTALSPPYRYGFDGRLRVFDLAYPDALTVVWQNRLDGFGNWVSTSLPAAPNWSGTVDQQFYAANGILASGAFTPVVSVNEIAPLRAWLSSGSLSSRGEDRADWRLQIRGQRFNSFTLEHASAITIEDGASSSDWTAGSNTTISATGGAIQFVISGGTGSGSMVPSTSPNRQNWEGYRYAKIRIQATGASQPFRLGANGKTWDLVTGSAGTYTDVLVDLCAPHNKTDAMDPQDTRWPLDTDGAEEGPYWGLNTVTTFTLSELENGQTFLVDKIELVREEWAKASLVPEFLGWRQKDLSIANREVKRFGLVDVDGRVGFDNAGQERSGSPWSYEYLTLTQLIGRFNEIPGFTATALGSLPADGFHDNSGYALWAGGSGAAYDYAAATWTEFVRRDLALGTLTVPAQALWDQWQGYPGIGRGGWTGEAYDPANTRMPAACTKHLHGEAWGLAFGSLSAVLSGKPVKAFATASSLTIVGTDTTGLRGEYVTELPGGKGTIEHTTELGSSPLRSDSEDWMNRRLARTSFRAADSITEPWLLSRFPHWLHEAAISAGRVLVRTSRTDAPVGGWQVSKIVTPSDTGCHKPVLAWDPKTARLIVVWERAGDCYVATSDSDGSAWSGSSLMVSGGYRPMVVFDKDGVKVEGYFVYDSGTSGPGKVKVRVTWPGDTSPPAWSNAKDVATGSDISVADGGFRNLTPMIDAGAGRVAMSIVIDGESEPSVWWCADTGGKKWKRVV